MPEEQGWYPGKHIKGLLGNALGKVKAHHAKFQRGGEYGPRTEEQQFNIAQERADATPAPSSDYAGKQGVAHNTGYGLTQHMMRDFDPSNNEEVLQMQRAMNAAGIKGADGKALKEDGMMGRNTERALRFAQGQGDEMESVLGDAQELRAQGIRDLPPGVQGPAPNTMMVRPEERDAQMREENPEMSWIDKAKQKAVGWLQQGQPINPSGPGGRMGSYSPPRGGGGRNY